MRRASSVLALLILTGCPHDTPKEPKGFVTAHVLADAGELLAGPRAAGALGDVVLANDAVRIVLRRPGPTPDFHPFGGSIVDADAVREDGSSADRLAEVFLVGDGLILRPDRMEIVADGTDQLEAAVEVEGELVPFAGLSAGVPGVGQRVRIKYRIRPFVPWIEIETTLVEGAALDNLGPRLLYGRGLDAFAPGEDGSVFPEADWVGGVAADTAVAWVPDEPALTWDADLQGGAAIGAAEVHRARLLVGADPGALFASVRTLTGVRTGRLNGYLRDLAGDIADDARLEVLDAAGHAVALLLPADDGAYATELPAGGYSLVASSPTRGRADPLHVDVIEDRTATVIFVLPATGLVEFQALDGVTPMPGRLTLYRDGAVVGETYSEGSAATVRARPGTYVAVVSRGPEWTSREFDVTVLAGQTVAVSPTGSQVVLQRTLDTTAFLAADLHLHTAHSTDSQAAVADVLTAAVGEGLELAALTDHDSVTDPSGALTALGVGAHLHGVAGVELSVPGYGHFAGFPVPVDPTDPTAGDGSRYWLQPDSGARATAEEILAGLRARTGDRVLQISHPRGPETGYFASIALDPIDLTSSEILPTDFDLVEVDGVETASFDDWLALVASGRAVTAVASPAQHDAQRPGYPRTWVEAGDDPATVVDADWIDALRAHRAVFGSVVFARVTATAGANTVGLGEVLDASGTGCAFDLSVHVESPATSSFNRLRVWGNRSIVEDRSVVPTLSGGRFQGDETVSLTATSDGFYVIGVQGAGDVYPLSSAPVFGVTNPIFVDCGGDGWDPPGVP